MWYEERNGKIRYFERYTDPLTGQIHRVSITLPRKSDIKALQLLNEKIAEKTNSYDNCTLKRAVDLYVKELAFNVTTATKKRNKGALNSIMAILGPDNQLNRITAAFVRNRFIESGKPARTLNGYITRFSAFIRWAYRHDLIDNTACIDKLKPFKDSTVRSRIQEKYLEPDELQKLLNQMPDEANKLTTQFLALTGMRIGELVALEEADLEEDTIHITKTYNPVSRETTHGKTFAACRDIHIQSELKACIKQIRALMRLRKIRAGVPRSPYFMISVSGKRLNYYSFEAYFKEYTEKILNRPLTPHALRHTHVSILSELGYPLDAIARRVGHEDSRVTKQIYLHITQKTKKRDNELLDALPPICPQTEIKKAAATIK